MDKSRNHHPQETDLRTENQTPKPNILTHRRVNNENTWAGERNITHWGMLGGGARGETAGGREFMEG